ncbi:hypothetical protein AB0J52_05330 [Spirillospora sp. NPDC049652]
MSPKLSLAVPCRDAEARPDARQAASPHRGRRLFDAGRAAARFLDGVL